jgi:gamma-glutamyltranspeptidase
MHIATYSKDGFAVSLTSTVNLIFGSLLLDPVTGIILNDEVY